jgi:hypothetical protein
MIILKNGFRIEFIEEKWSQNVKVIYGFKNDNIFFSTDTCLFKLSLSITGMDMCYYKSIIFEENNVLLNPFELPFGMYIVEIVSGDIQFAKYKLDVSRKLLF